jgi:hypothetical protein
MDTLPFTIIIYIYHKILAKIETNSVINHLAESEENLKCLKVLIISVLISFISSLLLLMQH